MATAKNQDDKKSRKQAEKNENGKTQKYNMLNIFMWLPAGKDIFGAADNGKNDTNDIKKDPDIEGKINEYLKQVIENIETFKDKEGNTQAYNDVITYIEPYTTVSNEELGCRVFLANFDYSIKEIPCKGIFKAFSNGLYLWTFFMPLNISNAEVKNFRNSFRSKHLNKLFHGIWEKNREKTEEPKYKGALNYTQKELLFDGIFNIQLHPEVFLTDAINDGLPDFSVNGVIRRILLYAWDGECKSTVDDRIDYSHIIREKTKEKVEKLKDQSLIFRGDKDVFCQPFGDRYANEQDERNLFISRLSYAAMEQFCRAALMHGLSLYRDGLDYVLRRVLCTTLVSKINKPPLQSVRPSFSELEPIPVKIESYVSMITAKLPLLVYFKELTADLSAHCNEKIIREEEQKRLLGEETDFKHKSETDKFENFINEKLKFDRGIIRKCVKSVVKSKRTFDASWDQLRRNIKIIEEDLKSINLSLEHERDDKNLHEISELRKIQDYSLEQDISDINQTDKYDSLIRKLIDKQSNMLILERSKLIGQTAELFVLGISVVALLVNLWNKANQLGAAAITLDSFLKLAIYFIVPLVAIFSLIHLFSKRQYVNLEKKLNNNNDIEGLYHSGDGKSDSSSGNFVKIIFELIFTSSEFELTSFNDRFEIWSQKKMIRPEEEDVCCEFSRVSIESHGKYLSRKKYSLKSKSDQSIGYTIHFEVLKYVDTYYLVSIRVIDIRPSGEKNVLEHVKKIASSYLYDLRMLTTENDAEVKKFLVDHDLPILHLAGSSANDESKPKEDAKKADAKKDSENKKKSMGYFKKFMSHFFACPSAISF